MQIGQKLQQLRKEANMTQYELAEKLFVSRDLVSKWESGISRPNRQTLGEIASLFGVSPEDIINPDDTLLSELSECIPEELNITEDSLVPVLNSFLGTLSDKERSIFLLRYLSLKDNKEIAEIHGMRTDNVRLILHRTRKKLKKHFTENQI